MLDQVMKKIEEAAGEGAGPLRKKKEGDTTVYTLKGGALGAAGRGGVFVVSKSKAKLTRALEVLDGKAAHLGTAKTFDALGLPEFYALEAFVKWKDG